MESSHVIFNVFILLSFFLPGVILACTTLMSGGIYTADCTGRGMIEIPLGLPEDIKALDFKNNSLTELIDNMFSNFEQLHHIYLSFNQIRLIQHEAFYGIKHLISLDLEGNQLTTVPHDVFHDMSSLVHLNLNRNPLKLLQDYAFPGLPALEVLTLEHCQINSIQNRAFLGLNQLKELSLVNNELTTLSSKIHTTLKSHTLSTLKLWGNPWHCDCNLRWIKVWLKMAQDDMMWWVGNKVPTCVSPHRMERREWPNLQIDHFACMPEITASAGMVNGYTGSNVSLSCEIFAKPKGKAKWYKGTNLLEEQNLYHIVNMYGNDYNFTTTLKLYNVNINDTGQYYCMGTNYAGQSESNVQLLVKKRIIQHNSNLVFFEMGTIIGIILAAVIVIALIVIVCYMIFLRNDRKKTKNMKKKDKQSAQSIASDIVYTSNTKAEIFEEDDGPRCTVKIKSGNYYSDPYRFPEEEDEDEEKTHIFTNQQHRQWQGTLGVNNPTASPSGLDVTHSNRSLTDTIRSNHRTIPSSIAESDASSYRGEEHRSSSSTLPRSSFRPEQRPFSSGYEAGYVTTPRAPPLVSPAESYHSSTYKPTIDMGKVNLDDDPYYYGTIV